MNVDKSSLITPISRLLYTFHPHYSFNTNDIVNRTDPYRKYYQWYLLIVLMQSYIFRL